MKNKFFECVIGSFSIKDAFAISDIFFEMDFLSVSCLEKDEKWYVVLLSSAEINRSDIVSTLSDYKVYNIDTKEIEDTDWLKKCFENFKPITVGNFFLHGSHIKDQVPKDKIPILIDAATAFGTGEHPTTNRCIAACQAFFDPKIHKHSLDVGCGSGVLSIAISKLGAECITACDIDEEAVRVSYQNMLVNKIFARSSVYIFQNRMHEFAFRKYDFIVANILSDPLIQMSKSIAACLNDSGILILSGFISSDQGVQSAYSALGLNMVYSYDMNEWKTLVFRKP